MHAAAIAAAGLEGWTYQRLPVPPALFTETARALGAAGFRGANVTIPHKEAALALADDASPAARAIGAANTLTYDADGTVHADNTDAPGLLDALAVKKWCLLSGSATK
jgi:shikimate dehydrogenase